MAEELKQYGLYKIIAGIIIFGLGITIMLTMLILNAESDTTDQVTSILLIGIFGMFILFFISLKVISSGENQKRKELISKLRSENSEISDQEIRERLKLSIDQVKNN